MDEAHDSPAISELTRRMTRGEDAAFRMFYERYYPRLHRYLWVVARGHDANAREALQATLLRVAKYVRVFDSEPVFWSWLTRVARTSLSDGSKQRRRYFAFLEWFRPHAELAAVQLSHIDASHDSLASDQTLLLWLDEAVADLPGDERTLVEERYFKSTPLRSLATNAARSEKAVQSQLARIREKLRRALAARLAHDTQFSNEDVRS